ncbi:hypothetical protein [Methylobacterium sp. ID0610]|uniref:hypothetical protein n=1 Tax=Methylobacterium carpenticola TaxID=3344827 RepID=UPI0036BD1A2C
MGRRPPPPTAEERQRAAEAARTLRAIIAGKAPLGARAVMHVDMSRPRRSAWIETWEGAPGLARVNGAWTHELLPGWQYTRAEVRAELIPDLEALAERGELPTEATSMEAS